MQNDLFDLLKQQVGCDYISDLRFEPNISIAKNLLRSFEFDSCSLNELNDMACYLFGVPPFSSKDAAVSFLISK